MPEKKARLQFGIWKSPNLAEKDCGKEFGF